MSRTIDYYFSLGSPWAFLGHATFLKLAAAHEVRIDFRPVFLPQVFAETGGVMLPQRHIARQRYRTVELQRWREVRGIALNLWPAFWPFDVTFPDRMLCAAVLAGADVGRLAQACWEATWLHERNLADAATLTAVATGAAFDGAALVQAAAGTDAERLYEANRTAAIASDVFGSPGYVLDGEVFWGQDRLDLLERALASRRKAYPPQLKP